MLKLKRPVVARNATLSDWPLILIDLYTEKSVIGRAYLEPYIAKSIRYLVPALHDLGEILKGRRVAPIEFYEAVRKSLHFVRYEGMSMIAVSGIDMAAWDALARGGWRTALRAAAMRSMISVSPGSKSQSSTTTFEGYARLTADLKTPVQIGENFYGPRALYTALQMKACDYVMPDFMRIGGVTGWQRAAAIAGAAGTPISTHLYPEIAAHVMRVSETAHWLEWQDWANPILQQPYEVKDGKLHIPEVPGIGPGRDEKAVAAHLVDSF